jgi:hypothetical protein
MASSSKSTSRSRQSQKRSTNGAKGRAKPTTKSNASSRSKAATSSRSSNGSRSGPTGANRSSATRSKSAAGQSSRSGSSRQNGNGIAGTIKDVAGKAKGPAVAVGATAVGVAGGMLIRGRMHRKRILGVPVPRSLGMPSLSNVDMKSMAKTVGKASKQFGKASKDVSKNIERVGDDAERIGKILS